MQMVPEFPARRMLRTPVLRRSCTSNSGTPARLQACRHAPREVSYRLAILTGKYMVIRLLASYGSREQREDSSGNRRRLGHITKQVSSMLRFLLVEAAQVTARSIPEWRSKYFHLAMRRGRKIAKVAMARRLAIVLYWMWHKGWDYEQVKKFGSHAGQPGPGRGA